jgi:hypothetical protein
MLNELETILKRIIEIRDSNWGHNLKVKDPSWFLALTALGSTAELLLMLIKRDTGHDQW